MLNYREYAMLALPRPIRRLILPASVWMAAAGLVACGDGGSDSKLLSQSASTRLTSTLDQLERMADEGDCDGAQAQAGQLRQQAGSLSSKVDVDLRNAVVAAASRLERLIAGQCTAAVTTTPAPAEVQQQPEENGNEEQNKDKGPKKPKEPKQNEEDQGSSEPVLPDETPEEDGGTPDSGSGGGTTDDGSSGF